MPEIVTPAFFDRDPELVALPTGHCPNWSHPEPVANYRRRERKSW